MRGLRRLRRVRSDPDPAWHTGHALWRFVAPTAAYGIMLVVAVDVLGGDADALDWLVAVVFLLVAGAAGAAWALLTEMGRRRPRSAPGDDAAGATT